MAKVKLRGLCVLLGGVFLFAALSAPAVGQQEPSSEELAKKTQNPVADLISVPLQSNWNFGAGTRDKTIYVLNVQPVIPISLNAEWNLITRIVTPIINQPALFPATNGATGLGDINPSFFLSPAKPGQLIWGVGPTFTLPAARHRQMEHGPHRRSADDARTLGIRRTDQQPVVGGRLGRECGKCDAVVAVRQLQPARLWHINTVPILTANWKAKKAGDVWTVPLGAGAGKLFRVGRLPINAQLAAYGNVAKPEFGPDWQLRFQVQFLFPK